MKNHYLIIPIVLGLGVGYAYLNFPVNKKTGPPESTEHAKTDTDYRLIASTIATTADSNANLANLRNELTGLAARVDALTRQLNDKQTRLTRQSTGRSGDEKGEAVPPDQSQSQREQTRQIQERLALRDTVFNEEALDPQWSATAMQEIQQAFSTNDSQGASVVAVDCRSTRCRVEMTGAGSGDTGMAPWRIPEAIMRTFRRGSVHTVDEGSGSTKRIIYLERG